MLRGRGGRDDGTERWGQAVSEGNESTVSAQRVGSGALMPGTGPRGERELAGRARKLVLSAEGARDAARWASATRAGVWGLGRRERREEEAGWGTAQGLLDCWVGFPFLSLFFLKQHSTLFEFKFKI